MISEDDKSVILTLVERYHAARIFLFGSSCDPVAKPRDIDLGVEGISPKDFFRFYGELILQLSKSADVVDLSFKCKFNDLIRKDGILIYDRTQSANRS